MYILERKCLFTRRTNWQNKKVHKAVCNQAEQILIGLLMGEGADVFKRIFEERIQCYFSGMYAFKVQHGSQWVPPRVIKNVNSYINDLVNWVLYDYVPSRDTGEVKAILCKNLQTELYTCLQMKSFILQIESYGETTLNVFLITANINLILMQELTFIDDTVIERKHSLFVHEIRRIAVSHVQYVEDIFINIVRNRLKTISNVSSEIGTNYVDEKSFGTVKWHDSLSRSKYSQATQCVIGREWSNGTPEHLEDKAKLDRAVYIYDTINSLHSIYSTALLAVNVWHLILSAPLSSNN